MRKLVCFGLGYSATHFITRYASLFASVTGTTREEDRRHEKEKALRNQSLFAHAAVEIFSGEGISPALARAIDEADVLLLSMPPSYAGDPAASRIAPLLRARAKPLHIQYLSTIAVYGDQNGGWCDETTPARPSSVRGIARLKAEAQWQEIAQIGGSSGAHILQIFRLPGIYGPKRNVLEDLRLGTARRIIKTGQVFNRIHVLDIANGLAAGLATPQAGIFNLTDDEPAPPQDVVAYGAGLLSMPPPPEISFAEAPLTPMGRSFYSENKRVSNAQIKRMLHFTPEFPNYRVGLEGILAELYDVA